MFTACKVSVLLLNSQFAVYIFCDIICIMSISNQPFISTYSQEFSRDINRFGTGPHDPTRADLEAIDRVLRHGSQEAHFIAGAMCEDLALRDNTQPDEQLRLLDVSRNIWGYATQKWWYRPEVSSWTLRSAANLAFTDLVAYSVQENALPSEEVQHAIYDDLLNVALRAAQLQALRTKQDYAQEAKDVTGVLAELALALVHNRFSLVELGGSQISKPSKITEDRGNIVVLDGANFYTGWDLSVFQDDSPEPLELVYKIQAKSRKNDDYVYLPGIVVVNISEDLAIGKKEHTKGTLRPSGLVRELFDDRHNPSLSTTKKLDFRTEKYLAKLDQQDD